MGAIWGCVDFKSDICSLESMDSEYKRKCKLDSIREKHVANSLFGCGLIYIRNTDKQEAMPYVLDKSDNIMSYADSLTSGSSISAVITADCIIDNRDELKKELSINEDNVTDGQIICYAYRKWHYDLASHLEGIFSIAIYDMIKKEMFLCVDPCACRCLYYYRERKTGKAYFSTLISPLQKVCSYLKRNEDYLTDYLAMPGLLPNASSTETPWRDMYLIEAGDSVIINASGIRHNRYFTPSVIDLPKNIDRLKEIFIDTYRDVVKKMIESDTEIGISLSGGFDSSSVAAMAASLLSEKNKKLHSYTYTPYYKEIAGEYPKNLITDETELVKKIAAMYPNIQCTFDDNEGKDITEYFDIVSDITEIPVKAITNIPVFIEIFKKAEKENVKIILNGQCGNLSVSYGNINDTLNYLFNEHRYITYTRYFSNYFKAIKHSRLRNFIPTLKKIRSLNKPLDLNSSFIQEESNRFVKKSIIDDFDLSKRSEFYDLYEASMTAQNPQTYKMGIYDIPALTYIGEVETKEGLYAGVVMRDPTRSTAIMNYCISIPFEYFCYNGIPRYLIRGFMKDMLPHDILFNYYLKGIQSADWLIRLEHNKENAINMMKEVLLKEEFNKYFDQKKISEYLQLNNSFDNSTRDDYLNLFILVSFASYINL